MTKQQDATFAELLRSSGHSLTKQRRLVFESLLGQEPLSMHELSDLLKGKMDRASVYRIVTVFEKLGIVQRLNFGWKYKLELSDKFAEHHHHLTCINCGRVIPINEKELESFITRTAGAYGFKTTAHQIEIQGYCDKCQKS